MPICKNCGDNNKKIILNYTPKSYTICPEPAVCPEPYACSEILDATCIQYTGNNIIYCDTSYVIINQFENLESILQSILNIICPPASSNLNVSIVPNPNELNLPTLSSIVTNGQPPYTYSWKIAQGNFIGHSIFGSITSSTLNLTRIAANAIMTNDINKNISISNIQLTVVDAVNTKKIVHFLYTSSSDNI
jgi:hypothetical protein